MNKHVYNLSLIIGVIFAAVGAGVQWGQGVGLMVFGGLVLAMTIYGVELAQRRRHSGSEV